MISTATEPFVGLLDIYGLPLVELGPFLDVLRDKIVKFVGIERRRSFLLTSFPGLARAFRHAD